MAPAKLFRGTNDRRLRFELGPPERRLQTKKKLPDLRQVFQIRKIVPTGIKIFR
jgi:hypothetical protein